MKKYVWRVHWKRMTSESCGMTPGRYASSSTAQAAADHLMAERNGAEYWIECEEAEEPPKPPEPQTVIKWRIYSIHSETRVTTANIAPFDTYWQAAAAVRTRNTNSSGLTWWTSPEFVEPPKPYEPRWVLDHVSATGVGYDKHTIGFRSSGTGIVPKMVWITVDSSDIQVAIKDAKGWMDMDAKERDRQLDLLYTQRDK